MPISVPNLKFLASTVPEIWRGSQNSMRHFRVRVKVRNRNSSYFSR